jgi:hypothetical protein
MRKPARKHQYTSTTWYGLPVEIVVSSENLHKVSVPGLVILHPGLVNLIVRQGLPLETRLELTALHEMGHLQTLPVPLLHLLLLFWPRIGHSPYSRWLRILMGVLTHQVLWEVAAESFVVWIDRRALQAKRPARYKALYVVFWAGMAVFAFLSTLLIMKREKGD